MLRAVAPVPASPGAGPPVTQYGSFDVQLVGLVPAIPTMFRWMLIAETFVVITAIGNGLWTSNSTGLTIPAGTLPQAIRPGFAPNVSCVVVSNNLPLMGRAIIASRGAGAEGGVFFACPDADGVLKEEGFAATGTKGLPLGTTFMYPLWS